ncbi:hypothetical protein CK203_057460 [Vitis vinifera]|uniref:Retrotransposon gag domain-containing protein n=1 Tax=Vitis vinifera TaxID=29760 RepID=A0A438GL98_VITVI|nr:hypothetical protein CK203_057460 [Vitis vinifera]
MSFWGIRMELLRIAVRAPCHQGEGSYTLYTQMVPLAMRGIAHSTREEFNPTDIPPSPDISHPEFRPLTFTFSGYFTSANLEMKKHQFNFELVSVVINFVDYSPFEGHNQGTPAGHESNGTTVRDHWEDTNQLRHQLGTNQMGPLPGKDVFLNEATPQTMCGGDFMSKNPEEAMNFLSYVVEVSRGWDEPNRGEVGKMNYDKRVEELELKKMHEAQAVAETLVQVKPCSICQSYEHLVEECPTILVAKEMFGEQANVTGQFKPNSNASYGNTYNSSWKNHPNFSWKPRAPQYQQPAQPSQPSQPSPPSQQASSLEQAIVNLSKCKRRVDFLLNLTKTPRVSTKWKLMRRIFIEKEEEETKKREEMKGKKKDISEGKETEIQQ